MLGIIRRLDLEAHINSALWALYGKSKRRDAIPLEVHNMVV
jgi:hypothetical protein